MRRTARTLQRPGQAPRQSAADYSWHLRLAPIRGRAVARYQAVAAFVSVDRVARSRATRPRGRCRHHPPLPSLCVRKWHRAGTPDHGRLHRSRAERRGSLLSPHRHPIIARRDAEPTPTPLPGCLWWGHSPRKFVPTKKTAGPASGHNDTGRSRPSMLVTFALARESPRQRAPHRIGTVQTR